MKTLKQLTLASAAAALLFTSLQSQAVIYTASNEAGGNKVIAFDVGPGIGLLTQIGEFDTQGLGSGAPLGNQAAMATDAADRWLFVTNAGDGSLTSFRLQPDGLEFVDREDTGGFSPISVTVFGTLVYVLSEGSGDAGDPPNLRYDTVTGMRFTAGGLLEAIPNSTRIIDDTQLTAPAQIGFNKSGTVLLITEKATNMITTYVMQQDDTPAADPLKRPSAVPTPFGFSFGDRDFVFITEANGGGQGVTASYRVDRDTGEVSGLVDLVDMGDATCWAVLSNDEKVGYAVNTGTDSISLFRVNFDGTLDPFFAARPNREIATGDAPRDAVLTQDGRFFYVLNNGEGMIRGYRTTPDGRILPTGFPRNVPSSVTGLVSR